MALVYFDRRIRATVMRESDSRSWLVAGGLCRATGGEYHGGMAGEKDIVHTDGSAGGGELAKLSMLLDELDIGQLADRWIDVESTRTPVGWSPDDARVRSTIERRFTEMVCAAEGGESITVSLEARLKVEDHKPVEGKITRFGGIGVFFATSKQIDVGAAVDLEVRRGDDQRLRVRGVVVEGNSSKLPEPGVRLKLAAANPAEERRVHRLLHELLRHRS